VLAPWVVSNLDRYGAPTANEAAREQQTEYLRPTGLFELGFGDGNRALVGGVFPQEWEDNAVFDRGEPPADVLAVAVFLAFAAGLVAAVRWRRWQAVVLLGVPFLLGVLMMNLTLATSDWYIFLPRYLHAAMLALAVLAAAMALRLRHGPAIVAGTVTTATAVAGALWVFGAGTGYFTNVGDAIGL
jgi:hypothetical protein